MGRWEEQYEVEKVKKVNVKIKGKIIIMET